MNYKFTKEQVHQHGFQLSNLHPDRLQRLAAMFQLNKLQHTY